LSEEESFTKMKKENSIKRRKFSKIAFVGATILFGVTTLEQRLFSATSIVYAEEATSTNLNWYFDANGTSRITTIKFDGNKVIGNSTSGGYSQYYLQLKVSVTGSNGGIRWTQTLKNQTEFEMGELQENDTITITPVVMDESTVTYDITGQSIPGLFTNDLNLKNGNLTLKFRNEMVTRAEGTGNAQVTYNVNAMTPDDPTSNPEYTVVIPTEYKLSDTQKLAAGTIALKDAKDVSKDYAGDQAVKVSVTSAKSFKFDNGGEYKLVDGVKANIPTEITLNKTTTSSVVNAQLTKEGSKTASADMLIFNYTVQ